MDPTILPPDQVLLELPVGEVAPGQFASLFRRLAEEGVTFMTLAEAQLRRADWLERFTVLDNATRAETGDPAVPRTPEEMRARLAEFELVPEACFLARYGDTWAGYTLLDPLLSRDWAAGAGLDGRAPRLPPPRDRHRPQGAGGGLRA